jgi:hypothetical protein
MARLRRRDRITGLAVALSLVALVLVFWFRPARAVTVVDEATFRAAWSNPAETRIDLTRDITLTCGGGSVQRNSSTPLIVDGHGHSITQACVKRVALVLDDVPGGGGSPVTFRDVVINGESATNSSSFVNPGSQVSQVIGFQVRERPQGRAPAAPAPALPVQAVPNFTG